MLRRVDSELTENSDILPEERNSRQFPVFDDETSEIKRNSRVFKFTEGDARNHLKKTFFSKNIFPVHKEKNPKFPLGTWHEIRFIANYTIKFVFRNTREEQIHSRGCYGW